MPRSLVPDFDLHASRTSLAPPSPDVSAVDHDRSLGLLPAAGTGPALPVVQSTGAPDSASEFSDDDDDNDDNDHHQPQHRPAPATVITGIPGLDPPPDTEDRRPPPPVPNVSTLRSPIPHPHLPHLTQTSANHLQPSSSRPLPGIVHGMVQLGSQLDAVVRQSQEHLEHATKQFLREDEALASMREQLRRSMDGTAASSTSFYADTTAASGLGGRK